MASHRKARDGGPAGQRLLLQAHAGDAAGACAARRRARTAFFIRAASTATRSRASRSSDASWFIRRYRTWPAPCWRCHRQQLRLSQSHTLHARPARPQTLLSRSDRGSLASLVADLFFREVVSRCRYGVDLHTAALHRTNLPQIRIAPGDTELLDLANAFSPP